MSHLNLKISNQSLLNQYSVYLTNAWAAYYNVSIFGSSTSCGGAQSGASGKKVGKERMEATVPRKALPMRLHGRGDSALDMQFRKDLGWLSAWSWLV